MATLKPLALVVVIAGSGCVVDDEPVPSRFGSALHTSPAACGQPAYQWVDDPRLGDVLDREELRVVELTDSQGFIDTLRESDAADVAHVPQRRVFLDRFRYQTQDRGQLVEATGLYAFPDPKEVDGPLPLVIYTHGTSGYSDACAPSHLAEGPTATDAAIIGVFASVFDGGGAVVVAPDYLGMAGFGAPSTFSHPYMIAEPTAIAALDAGRAARQLAADDGLTLNDGVVVAGGSQGGHAAALTARYAPHYATDITLIGTVNAIPPLDLLGHAVDAVSGGLAGPVNVGNIVAGMVAAQRWYGVPRETLLELVDEAALDDVEATMDSGCALPEIELSVDELFAPDAVAAARAGAFEDFPGPWGCIFSRSSLVDTDVERLDDTPGLVVLGTDDTLVEPGVERRAVAALCEQGMTLAFQECAGRDHGGAFLAAIDDMLAFLEARVRGDDVVDACVVSAAGLCGSDPGP
ncbi:MAG: lipase family protein [Deltaproteobacteria bacterium]|nr:lipase family protein [Deltaproteobacteria bacterium]